MKIKFGTQLLSFQRKFLAFNFQFFSMHEWMQFAKERIDLRFSWLANESIICWNWTQFVNWFNNANFMNFCWKKEKKNLFTICNLKQYKVNQFKFSNKFCKATQFVNCGSQIYPLLLDDTHLDLYVNNMNILSVYLKLW